MNVAPARSLPLTAPTFPLETMGAHIGELIPFLQQLLHAFNFLVFHYNPLSVTLM